jgi:futalosine hydrolase
MKILLVAATQQEIQPILIGIENLVIKPDVLITGVGIASTAYHLTKQLHHHHYDLVIQAGIAGVLGNAIHLGDVVLVKQDCFAELGAIENNSFKTVQQMGFSNEPEWITNNLFLLNKLPYAQVKAITVNTVTDDANTTARLQQKWQAHIETMEGAAFHYVCQHQQVNYMQIRSISNAVGQRNKTKWKTKEAIENLNTALANIINIL